VLFLLATVLSGQAVLPRTRDTDIHLTALGALLIVAYMLGLVFRPQRQWSRVTDDHLRRRVRRAAPPSSSARQQ
jgi:cation:H+ antiporter